MNKSQLIIALEGIDGAGKTTLANLLDREFGDRVFVLSRTKKGKLAKKILNYFPVKRFHILQVPLYLLLSYINYLKSYKKAKAPIMIMDRCFLSNICYFYPSAMNNWILFKFAMLFELKLYPKEIFIIDENPEIAQKRDNMGKELKWLIKTRNNYLNVKKASALINYNITIVPNNLTIQEKQLLISNRINELRRLEYGS